MLTVIALLATLLLGLLLGLAYRGCLLLGDRAALDELAQRLLAEQRIDRATRQTLQAMRSAARRASE